MIAVDFFCGAGGLTRGLMNVQTRVVLGIDLDPDCQKTYEFNNRPAKFLNADLRKLSPRDVRPFLRGVKPKDLLFVGCAPCQPFSTHRRGMSPGRDGTLLSHFARFVEEFQPGQLIIENVPGMARVGGYSTYQRFKSTLSGLTYKWADGVLDAKDYGVPQNRRRLILIAMQGREPTLPPRTHGPNLLPYVTVKDAIRDLPRIGAGEIHPRVPNHRASALSPINLARLRSTPPDGGGRLDWDDELVLDCHKDGYDGHTDVYGRMSWKRPAPTLTCRCHSISNGRYGHPEQDRAISLREAARLQTFEDDFVFFGQSKDSLATQIGNAVPVRFAEELARHIIELRSSPKGTRPVTHPKKACGGRTR